MSSSDQRSDTELLAATGDEPEAFAAFYRIHARAVLGYLLSRTRRADLAADLCAEVFASALENRDRYDPERAPPRAWLLAIARSTLLESLRRGRVEDAARRRLAMPVRSLTDEDIERVEELVDLSRDWQAEELVADLPDDQRAAVLARVVDEREYAQIAAELEVSQAVVRQRVSRGLAHLRARLEEGGR